MVKVRLSAVDRKRLIIKEAIEVFSKSNYRLAKVPEIAERSFISEAMVYKYFKTKKNLFLTTLDKIGDKTIEQLHNANERAPEHTAKQVENMCWDYLQSMSDYEKELTIFYQAISEIYDEDVKATVRNIYKKYTIFIKDIIIEGIKKREISDDVHPENFSWQLVGHLIHFSTFYLLDLYKEDNAKVILNQHLQLLEKD